MLSVSQTVPTSPPLARAPLRSRRTRSPLAPSRSPSSCFSCRCNAEVADDYHSTLRALNSRGRVPRKSLGQHYMLNSSINEQLSSLADVKDGDVILEIGPGTGSLTSVLINSGATVIAVEKDPHMAMLVRDRFDGINQLLVLEEDFTKCHIRSHLGSLLESRNSPGET